MASGPCTHKDTRAFGTTICCVSCGKVRELTREPMVIPAFKKVEFDYKPYNYQALRQDRKEIRLLMLLPDPPPLTSDQLPPPFPSGEQPIHCHLETMPLYFAPACVAVSYTWTAEDGDSSRSQPLIICSENPEEGKFVVWVTTNCANLLRQVRACSKIRTIWVDAVCINQDQISEQNSQVSMMGRIYKKAERVDICISYPRHDFSPAVKLLTNDNGVLRELELATDPALVRQATGKWEPLFNLKYFSRVWV
jgi:hypothetical protein